MLCTLGCAADGRQAPAGAAPEGPSSRALLLAPGSYHAVGQGQTLRRIAKAYGMSPRQLAAVSQAPEARRLPAGEQTLIPLPKDSPDFSWPVLGQVRKEGILHGVEIEAPHGSVVRAARRGRVAVATQALAGRGPTLVLSHEEGYASVYAGVGVLLVAPGAEVAQGSPIARLGHQPLHFEIRREAAPVPVLSLLPQES